MNKMWHNYGCLKFHLRSAHNQKLAAAINLCSAQDQQTTKDYIQLCFDDITKEDLFQRNTSQIKWIQKIVDYNVMHGKHIRSQILKHAYGILKPNPLPEEHLQAHILSGTFEIFQGCALIEDDLMDQTTVRRGRTSWYILEGNKSINDSSFLQASIPYIITRFLKTHKYYLEIMDLMCKMQLRTSLGQNMDLEQETITNFDEKFKTNRYYDIAQTKTGYYTVVTPILAALYLAHINDPKLHQLAAKLALKIGLFFQIQDDYLDCYGDPKVIGKIGTDIENGKNTWLVQKGFELMTPEQKDFFKKYYGQRNPEYAAKIKQLYKELNLKEEYLKMEKEYKRDMESDIEALDTQLPKEIFYGITKRLLFRRE